MIRRVLRAAALCAGSAAWIAWLLSQAAADDHASTAALGTALPRAAAAVAKPLPAIDALAALSHAHQEDERWVATDAFGRRIEFSLAPALQTRVQRILHDYQVPYAALVAIEPASGRVLAYVSHSSANPNADDLARDPTPPAASVFKLITASALIDAGVVPETRMCYGGGSSRLEAIDLQDDRRRDGSCASLAEALGNSINAVFAKLADRHLDATTLRRYATSFGFGQKLPFAVPLPASPAEFPSERLEFARTAAGFWHVHMSPLHAALIAATFANGGQMPAPTLVDRVVGADGRVSNTARAGAPRSVLAPATAHSVAQMMLRTVQSGTAHSAFFDERGRPLVPGVAVAGKTGSLNGAEPFRAYSWWVGFAPADKPTIALAALIVNTAQWRIKSSFLAREALHAYLNAAPSAPPARLAAPAKLSVR